MKKSDQIAVLEITSKYDLRSRKILIVGFHFSKFVCCKPTTLSEKIHHAFYLWSLASFFRVDIENNCGWILNRSDRYEIFRKEWAFEEFSSQEKFWLVLASSLQARIPILSRYVGYHFWDWMNSAESVYHWSKRKEIHVTLFLWTFDLLLALLDISRLILQLDQRHTVRKYILQMKI